MRSAISVVGRESEPGRVDPEEALNTLFPAELRRLILVDVALVDEVTRALQSRGALERLLRELSGLKLMERLRSDLLVLGLQDGDSVHYHEDAQTLERLGGRQDEIEANVRQLRLDLEAAELRVAVTEQQIADQERELVAVGGQLAQNRPALKSRLEQIEADLEVANAELRELCAGLLPFSLCSELCTDLEKRLDQEAAGVGTKNAAVFAEGWLQDFCAHLASDGGLRTLIPDKHQRADLVSFIGESGQRRLSEIIALPETALLHDLSERERVVVRTWIGEIHGQLPKRAERLRDELDRLERIRDEIMGELDRVPDDAGLAEVQVRLRELRGELVDANSLAAVVRQHLDAAERERVELLSGMRRLDDRLAEATDARQRTGLIGRIRLALTDFEQELLRRRNEQFASALVERFNRLSRKQSLLANVSFDPAEGIFRLEDANGRDLDSTSLSTGELQLFAMAILDSLRLTTGRAYPLVIDTPLAYLDKGHRRSLMTHAVFKSANQVILFATDQEIDANALEAMASDFTYVYRLSFDPSNQSSQASTLRDGASDAAQPCPVS
jgi:DNA sulfur modification protein DndD